MAYATQQDLIDRFGEERLVDLTDRATPPAGAIDATVVAQALDGASATIDAYVGARYALPLSQTPLPLQQACEAIAFYQLHVDSAPDKVVEDYKAAMRFLSDVATGKVALPLPAGDTPTTAGGAETVGPDRIFSRDSLDGY